ncbi:MAG: TonB family protein [Betaproteobacteria bacterium]
MAFDPSMLCARTTAGEAELATPSQGLSLGQRRVLTLLQHPAAVEELALKHQLEPDKLARDLTRLADLKLVRLQGPTVSVAMATPKTDHKVKSSPVPTSGAATPAMPSMTPVIIGRSRRSPMLPLAAGVAALLLALGIWFGTRGNPAPRETAQPMLSLPTPAPIAPAPPLPAAKTTIDGAPAIATVLRGNAHAPEMRPEIRPGLPTPVVAPHKAPVESATIAVPTDSPPPAIVSNPAPVPVAAPPAAAVAAPPVAAVVTPPAPSNVPAEAPPAVQLATVAPAPVAPRPPVATALKAISREPPDFPREAEGLNSGIVNARIHVDARGNVTSVDILGSQPPKVFDKAARKALLRWQFEPLASGQTANLDVDVKFQRD